MLNKGVGPEGDWKVKTATSGEGSDCCPNCGTSVDAQHVLGDVQNPSGYIYGHDLRDGGCGATWNRTGRAGIERAAKAGYDPKWPVTSVAVGRVYFTPSKAYRDNFDRAFGHG